MHSADAATPTGRLRGLSRLALASFGLCVLVVAASAYLRLSGAGLGCGGWPECYGQVLAGVPHAPWEGARLVHRIVATAALLAGIALAWRAWRPHPLRPAARYAGLLLALMLFLSVVGVGSADPRLVAVSFVNLVGGLGLVSFSWRTFIHAGTPALPVPAPGLFLRLGLSAITATVLLGALIGARYAAPACASLPGCGGAWWPAAEGWVALNPFGVLAGPAQPGDAGGVALHLLHRYLAVAAGGLLAVAAWRLRGEAVARPAALAVLALLGIEMGLGVLTVASGFQLWLAVAHNVGAGLLLAAAATLMQRTR